MISISLFKVLKDSTIYNGALDSAIDKVRSAINPAFWNQFDFKKAYDFNQETQPEYEKEK